ncbi:MAG: PAS domain S-box/diguanylate cyclase (GGDEF) domain-containing protein [Parcubacteria group bacterium GW2011_GWC2_39_14]|nr:MAG: PAS domain S-box/diguanylate cyclase (GGDEF) domain-containing protein [Parcubacteria group bacterium GW2011_GWC2_39_14]KKR55400.1 MAG: PAS domain S-box/diguanylate cyclase (GGDEF) domain-containing protein [Parcubacteria group bacterium GW2011_GWA2_40_23]
MVLFVDDLPENLALFKAVAGTLPHRTHHSPFEALKCLSGRSARVIVTDHDMPGMTGAEFIVYARRLCPDARIIMVSSAPPEHFSCAEQPDEVVTKPFDAIELRRKIKKIVAAA